MTGSVGRCGIYCMPVPEQAGVIPRSLLRENAYRSIRDAIVDGTLAPGERLNDAELAQWLGVSRTPVREALTRLEEAGLVHTKPGRYTMVSPIDARAARAAQTVTAAMHELAVREAVPQLSPVEIEAMRVANRRFAEALERDDVDAAIASDDEFHGVAVTASANPALRTVLEQFTPVLRRMERLRFSSLRGRDSVALHDRIITLCETGDAEAAATAARENWLSLDEVFDVDPAPGPAD
ncbi:GntR family transcriptional regulator [Actinoplanes sp. TRM 88003]|uniref:GntR family transcriptional regulator n=1 Tax=Paractinoplanes aksuensis TaxID=2939490 RepID=A0ABT1DXE9_9ACTN|nr:GntR family transcriptional regulator [Actinoplanes aksuensis]MCO8275552.1 GntR family transcriptional regulator [Actinoplanes aksuensis]